MRLLLLSPALGKSQLWWEDEVEKARGVGVVERVKRTWGGLVGGGRDAW